MLEDVFRGGRVVGFAAWVILLPFQLGLVGVIGYLEWNSKYEQDWLDKYALINER